MSDQASRRTGSDPAGAEREGRPDQAAVARPENAAARDIDAEGRPLARQEDEAAGTGAPGVDVGRPDAFSGDLPDGGSDHGSDSRSDHGSGSRSDDGSGDGSDDGDEPAEPNEGRG